MGKAWWLLALALGAGCEGSTAAQRAEAGARQSQLLPVPASLAATGGVFVLTASARLGVPEGDAALAALAEHFAEAWRGPTGDRLPIVTGRADVEFTRDGADPALGDDGYRLTVTEQGVTIAASTPAGAFYGAQTLSQLFPPALFASARADGPWLAATGTIVDQPRFAWRGVMLDVARHFFGPDEVKKLIDTLARFKVNRVHLHLTDDQGWRLEIPARPRLTQVGGASAVGGGAGGFFSTADYADLVAFAAQRFVQLVPEIDLPGHCNAALTSDAELNCDGLARPPYTGTAVGVSSVCTGAEPTWAWVDDVVSAVAAQNPGGWLHLGGDEAAQTPPADYVTFLQRYHAAAVAHGLQPLGWEETARAGLGPASTLQVWLGNVTAADVPAGTPVVLSPAKHAYLDMKYAPDTGPGTFWAGFVDVQQAYDWDPERDFDFPTIAGVEAALWTEFVATPDEVEQMMFPRALGVAELGWSPRSTHQWSEHRARLRSQGPRLEALGVGFYRSPQVDW